MKIPSRFKLRGKTWTVDFSADLQRTQACVGICHPDRKLILLDESLEGDELLNTWLHELLHALFPAKSVHWTLEQEERIVSMLAPRLLEALRNTGWVKR